MQKKVAGEKGKVIRRAGGLEGNANQRPDAYTVIRRAGGLEVKRK